VLLTPENNFGFDTSVCDWRYRDTSWPYFQTPSFLSDPRNRDVAELLVQQISQPKKFIIPGPYHSKKDSNQGEWKYPYMQWINHRYDLKLFRIVHSWTESYPFTAINLGDGYWLEVDGFNPADETRIHERALYLAFFWTDRDEVPADGGLRLRKFLEYFATMPDNPFEHCFLRPTGDEILEEYGAHLKILGYTRRPKHKTDRLVNFYKYWLNAKPTKYIDGMGKPFYRAECYKPISVLKYKDPWPWPELLVTSS